MFGQTVEPACIYFECSDVADAPPSNAPTIAARWSVLTPCSAVLLPPMFPAVKLQSAPPSIMCRRLTRKNTQFSNQLLVKGDTGKPCCLWCGHFPDRRLGGYREKKFPFSGFSVAAVEVRFNPWPSAWGVTHVTQMPGERSYGRGSWVKVMVLSRSLNFLLTRCITLPPSILDYPSCLSVCVCVSVIL